MTEKTTLNLEYEVKYRVQLQSGIFTAPDTARRIDAMIYRTTSTQEMGCAIGNCTRAVKAVVKHIDEMTEDEFNTKLAELEAKHTSLKPQQTNTSLPPVTATMFANIVAKTLADKESGKDDKPKWKSSRGAAWTSKKQREFALWSDANFRAGDLFVTLSLSEESREKADEKLKQWRKTMRKFVEGQLAAKYGRTLIWRYIGVKEYGKRGTKRKHFHLLYAVVDQNGNDVTNIPEIKSDCKKAIEAEWSGRGGRGGYVGIRTVDRKLGVLCYYLTKDFDENPTYAHAYFKSDSLIPFETTTLDITEEEFNAMFQTYYSGDIINLCEYIEGLPQMQGYRLMKEPQVHSPDPTETEDSPFIRFTILNIRDDIATGKVSPKRNIGDMGYFYGETEEHLEANTFWGLDEKLFLGNGWDCGFETPSGFFADTEVEQYDPVYDLTPSEDTEQRCYRDNAPSAPPPSNEPMPRQRKITSLGLAWFENLPIPQAGRRIVQSNGLIFDEVQL